MQRALPWIALVVALAAATGWYYWSRLQPGSAPAAPQAPVAAAPAVPPELQPPPPGPAQHPIEHAQPAAAAPAAPVPPLAESDKFILDALVGSVGRDAVLSWFNVGDYVRRIVVTVDNLPQKRAPARLWPVTAMPGSLATAGRDAAVTIDATNAARYAPFIRVVESMDTGRFVALYVHLYPLFQQAYAELGHGNRHFNDRLVEVIDHLLAAPEPKGPLLLTKPWIMWEYADPQLEALSAGQKTLVRVGPENAARLKAKLRDIRRQVAAAPPKE
jgi:hypothetical protein